MEAGEYEEANEKKETEPGLARTALESALGIAADGVYWAGRDDSQLVNTSDARGGMPLTPDKAPARGVGLWL